MISPGSASTETANGRQQISQSVTNCCDGMLVSIASSKDSPQNGQEIDSVCSIPKRLPVRAASPLIPRMSGSATAARAQSEFDIGAYLERTSAAVNKALDRALPAERVKPATIHKAMRYSLFAGGKRLRPALCIAAAEACGGKMEAALPYACAVECIHTYSLIHDDLPAMDDDDYRRGKLTNHKVFGEGIAVLAGDALLTQAFEIAAKAPDLKRYTTKQVILEIAEASGSLQLIAGQVADLESEGKKISAPELKYIHERKTSALLRCSARLGGMSANCNARELEALTDFGYHVGLAFQVIDDILDVTQTSEQLGKTAGKDQAAQKATYPSILGMEKSRAIAKRLTNAAFAALKPLGKRAAALEALATYLLQRDR
jgi:geranylgeranyl diphosphate synthase type II